MSSPNHAPDIGIVTALPVECYGVQTIMDDLEEVPDEIGGDWATYYVGSVPSRTPGRPHRVVLCLLPEDGGVAAAHGCANLARTWAVRHILMCGIACGVPNPMDPERHVRLGDILVAEDGVVPYGHVRVDGDGEQLRRPAARPSVVLRNAARRLRIAEEAGQRPWERWLDVNRRPNLEAYARPPASTDILFDDETGKRIRHPPLSQSKHLPGRPRVHYGLLGSGGKLIRTSIERDRLVRKHRLIGFDMEGDGVADATYLTGIDWFMVRGVSDYGSRKNDTWHRYASLAAAAYTRSLLEQLKPVKPAPTPPPQRSEPVKRPDAPTSDREEIVAILLKIRTMRGRAGRDRIIEALPDAFRHRIPRGNDTYHDVCGFVAVLSESAEGLGLLLAALRAVEGDSRPVQRFAELLN
jgi:nucleoside phosphorylase